MIRFIKWVYYKLFLEKRIVNSIKAFHEAEIDYLQSIYNFIQKASIKEKEMAELTSKKRKKLKKSTFGLPGERKYPMPDRAHAANAKARATQMVNKGKLSESQKEKIDAKANKILGKKSKKK